MLSPTEEAKLRDEMCVVLLEATSHPNALTRARREERTGVPAYDPVPMLGEIRFKAEPSRIDPRDLVESCALCGRAYVNVQRFSKRFCSQYCQDMVRAARRRRGLAA